MKKKILSLILAICLIIPCSLFLTACGSNTLTNDSGFKLKGGGFEKGSVLNTTKVESTTEDAETIFGKLENNSIKITNTSNAMIYDIFVSKDDQKVQPNGKVAVSVKVEKTENGYKVFHIKDDNTVEELSATYKDGTLTFETSSFSYFVIVPTGDVTMNNNAAPTAGSKAEWDKAINYWQAQTNVRVLEEFAYIRADGSRNISQTMIYQLKDGVYSEGEYINDETEGAKSKAQYVVKNGDTYYRVEWSSGKTEDDGFWEKVDYMADSAYSDGLERNIYKCIDFYAEPLDLSYSKFTYDATNKIYKNSDNTINVAFTFESGTLTKIVVTVFFDDGGTMRTSTRTITFDADITIPSFAGSEVEWNKAIYDWQNANNVNVFERTSSPDDDDDEGARIEIFQIQNNAYSYETYGENLGKGSKPSRYIVKDGNNYFRYEADDDGVKWYKTSEEHTKDLYEGALKNIYECSDLNDKKIDFSYDKFDYDSSTKTYKYKENNNITVKLNFDNGDIDNIVITRIDDSTTYVRTITFDAEVNVPTENVIDETVSE